MGGAASAVQLQGGHVGINGPNQERNGPEEGELFSSIMLADVPSPTKKQSEFIRIQPSTTVDLPNDGQTQVEFSPQSVLATSSIKFLEISQEARELFLSFIRSKHNGDYEHIQRSYVASLHYPEDKQYIDAIMETVRKLFPHFLASTLYINWCGEQMQRDIPLLGSDADFDTLEHTIFSNTSKGLADREFSLVMFDVSRLMPEYSFLGARDQWFRQLFEVVDSLKLCLFLSTVNQEKEFPILYANVYTDEFIHVKRSALIGKANPFLGLCTQSNMNDLMSALPCKYSFKNTCFPYPKGIVTMFNKPIYDTKCKYQYIFSVVTDDTSEANMRTIGTFMSIIPTVVFERFKDNIAEDV